MAKSNLDDFFEYASVPGVGEAAGWTHHETKKDSEMILGMFINKHVFFINLYANLRAKNYRIPNINEQETKMIAGRIVQAIANTTTMITGFACMQLITLLNSENILLLKNCYLDTSINNYQINNPSDVTNG